MLRSLADDLAGIFAVGKAVAHEAVDGRQALDEHVFEFHKEAVLGHADNQGRKFFADAILHEFDLLPLHQLAFGIVGAALGLAADLGQIVQLLFSIGNLYWTAARARFSLPSAIGFRSFSSRLRHLSSMPIFAMPRLLAVM